jgi:hypothetical protein
MYYNQEIYNFHKGVQALVAEDSGKRSQLNNYYMKQSNPRVLVFSLGCKSILLLTLGSIKDLDVKLQSTTMVFKQQDLALM